MNLHPEMLNELMNQRQQALRADAGAVRLPGVEWLRRSRRNNRVRTGRGADTLAACGPNVVPVR